LTGSATNTYVRIPARYRRERSDISEEVTDTMSIALSDAALLLIDVYLRDGPPADIVRRTIVPIRAMAHRVGLPVVFVTNQLVESIHRDSESRAIWRRSLGQDVLETWREPTDVLRYLPEIAPTADDLVVPKPHYSGFSMTSLDEVLKSLQTRVLFVAGFEAHICVTATITDALYRNYRVVLLRDAIGAVDASDPSPTESAVNHTIRYVERCVGYTATTDDFLRALEQRHTRS
jgi:nicotinamidase-related amidase